MNNALVWARRLFALWIAVVSAVAAWHFSGASFANGAPGWLMFAIAAIETVAAVVFLWRPAALAMAGLLASFAAAAVIHVQLGQQPWQLMAYAIATILFYQIAQRKSHD